MTGPSAPRPLSLLEDGSLSFAAAPEVFEAVRSWLPRLPREAETEDARAAIRVEAGAPGLAAPDRPAEMEMYGVRGWLGGKDGRVVLADGAGRIGAAVELAGLRATVRVEAEGPPPDPADVFATFTISAALLLGRLRRALLHAAAVVAPGGGAWLLPGSSFSGKSTTCLTLIRGGWNWLSDDHVVLAGAEDGGIVAEGWPRAFHLDRGYADGTSHGVRSRVEPHAFGPGRWQRSAPVAGILFPRVEADRPTVLEPLHPAAALGLLVRQSPFVLADPGAAGPVLELLRGVAALPACGLRLGGETFCDAEGLAAVLDPAVAVKTQAPQRV